MQRSVAPLSVPIVHRPARPHVRRTARIHSGRSRSSSWSGRSSRPRGPGRSGHVPSHARLVGVAHRRSIHQTQIPIPRIDARLDHRRISRQRNGRSQKNKQHEQRKNTTQTSAHTIPFRPPGRCRGLMRERRKPRSRVQKCQATPITLSYAKCVRVLLLGAAGVPSAVEAVLRSSSATSDEASCRCESPSRCRRHAADHEPSARSRPHSARGVSVRTARGG